MTRLLKSLLAAVLALAVLPPAWGQNGGAAASSKLLEVGDAAPPLEIERWVRGEPFNPAANDKPYVVVFNLTTCPACRKALPYLSELSDEYADDIPIVSVFAHELAAPNDPMDLGSVKKVNYLLEAMGDEADMPTVVDGPERKIKAAWNVFMYPIAFLIQDEKVAWIGDPVWLGPVLQKVRSGAFDPQTALREQEAYRIRLQAARDAAINGDFKKGLNLTEALIAKHPYENALYFLKYSLLAQSGARDKADAFLQHLIDTDMERFDWDHFVYETFLTPKDPNFDLSLAAADKAIEHAETDLVAAALLSTKAKIYLARSRARDSKNNVRRDLQNAIDCLERAAALSTASGDPRDSRRFETELYYYEFKIWSGVNDSKANSFLAAALSGETQRGRWNDYIKDALKDQKKPDYQLLLWAADRAMAEAYDEMMRAAALASKGAVYAEMDNFDDAITLYERALDEAEFAGDDQMIDKYKRVLFALTRQYKQN